MKQCNDCKQKVDLHLFAKDKRNKSGYAAICKACAVQRTLKSREANKDNYVAYQAKRSELDKERRKQYMKQYRKENKERIAAYNKQWMQDNRGRCAKRSAKRRALKLNATPLWANEAYIADLYENAQEANNIFKDYDIKFEVDHVIPLQGELVCGLHVENNLQILSQTENRSKSNYYEVI